MGKLLKTLTLVVCILVFTVAAEAAQPLDGHYQGLTSQEEMIGFEVIDGQVQPVTLAIYPTCNDEHHAIGLGNLPAAFYGDIFTFDFDVVQDPDGYPVGTEPGSVYVVFGYGKFDTPTHASGEIWHTVPIFTGARLETSFCFNRDVTFEVDRTGPTSAAAATDEPTEVTVTITEDAEE